MVNLLEVVPFVVVDSSGTHFIYSIFTVFGIFAMFRGITDTINLNFGKQRNEITYHKIVTDRSLSANGDTIGPGERALSTANRNFAGRQGPGSRTHITSPVVAALSACVGAITDPRRFGLVAH